MNTTELLRSLSIVWSLFHILILFIFLYQPRYSRRKTFLFTFSTMIVLVAVNVTGLIYLGNEKMLQLCIFTATIPSFILFWLLAKNRNGRFFFTFCLSDTFSLWIIIVTNLLDFYLGGGRCVIMFFSRLILFPLAEWFVWRHLRKPYLEIQNHVEHGWTIATALGAIYYLLLIASCGFPNIITSRPEDLPALLFILLLMPFTYAALLFTLYQQFLSFRIKEIDRTLQVQKESLETQLASYEGIRKLHHDMKAFRVTLMGLLENKKYEEAKHLLSEMNLNNGRTAFHYCSNPYINAVLSEYTLLFRDNDVSFEARIQVDDIIAHGIELSLIFSNALDNSLRAVLALPKEKRKVSVQLRRKNAYLLLRIRNSCSPSLLIPQGTIPSSTKTESGHGYGLATICQTAESLDGTAVCYAGEGQFVLDVLIKHNKELAEIRNCTCADRPKL